MLLTVNAYYFEVHKNDNSKEHFVKALTFTEFNLSRKIIILDPEELKKQ